jgi:hypothetical protein
MQTPRKNYFKFFATLVLCLLVRLIPFRAPNIEPIMAATMPVGRIYGAFSGFSFAFLSILLYDIITHTLGIRTLFTAGAYGLVGLASVYYFKKRQPARPPMSGAGGGKTMDYVRFAIYGTLFFDIVTGLTVGPIFFHQSFIGSLVGQIPFTALHLLGNITLSACLSPGLYHFLIRKRPARNAFGIADAGGKKESVSTINTLNPKII